MEICNKKIEEKLQEYMSDQEITKVMHKASRSFLKQLDTDEIYTCQINALWKSIKNFKESKNTKFTTYLYTGVVIECIKNLKFNSKYSKKSKFLHDNIPTNKSNKFMIDLLDEAQNETELEILIHRSERKTIEEIGKIMGKSRETIRKQIKKMETRIRPKFY